MAIAFVKDFYAEANTSPITLTVPTGGIAAGNTLVLFINADTDPTTVTGIADASGTNSYNPINSVTTSPDVRTFLWYGVIATGLAAASSVTVTLSGGGSAGCIAGEFSGLSATPLDRDTAQEAFTDTHTSGLTLTTTQADELLVGGHAFHTSAAFTSTGGFIQNETQNTFGIWRTVMQYLIVSVAAQYESTGTTVAAQTANSHIATFKAAAEAPPAGDTTTRRHQIRRSRMTSW